MTLLQQIPLRFTFNAEYGFEQFHPGSNSEVLTHLRSCAQGGGETLIYLWGETGEGKTHLLHACCQTGHGLGQTVSYIPMHELKEFGTDILEDLENQNLVCLDDLEAIAGRDEWEHALFRLFNRLRERNHCFIVSARVPPTEIPLRLPDLKTRLSWGLTLMLRPLNDEDKLAALSLHARTLGLQLSPQVGRFLMSRYQRDLPSLCQLLDRLDQATLVAKRKLTVPFLKVYLEGMP